MQDETMAGNAQLRAINSMLTPRSLHMAAPLLWPMSELKQPGPGLCGVTAFGASGVVGHIVMSKRRKQATHIHTAILNALTYQRRAFAWHEPSHPFAQRLEVVDGSSRFQSPAAGALHTLVADHVVQGRVVFPGSAHLELARAASTAGAALKLVFFVLPLAAEAPTLLIECVVHEDRFEVRSGVPDSPPSEATVHCKGEFATAAADMKHVDRVQGHIRGEAHATDVGALYDAFDAIELQFGPRYRNLERAWGGAAGAMARLRNRATHEGTAVHPADLDDALRVGALMSSGGGETRLPFAVDDALLHGEPRQLLAVRALASLPTCGSKMLGSYRNPDDTPCQLDALPAAH